MSDCRCGMLNMGLRIPGSAFQIQVSSFQTHLKKQPSAPGSKLFSKKHKITIDLDLRKMGLHVFNNEPKILPNINYTHPIAFFVSGSVKPYNRCG